MRIELMECQRVMMQEIGDPAFTRDDVALTYAMTLTSSEASKVDWPLVNAAIVSRWSGSALRYIKNKAWNLCEEKRRAQE